jgi:2-polyprenyl-3-methyl-5-hydroxy-6-metoxy-1,4-benzoquinol methylase
MPDYKIKIFSKIIYIGDDCMKDAYEIYDRQMRRVDYIPPKDILASKSRRELASHATWLPADKGIPILDVGCGWGHNLLSFWAAGHQNLTGVDISEINCDICRQGLPEAIQIVCENAFSFLQSVKGKYGLITMSHVLEHIPKEDSLRLVSLCRDALIPGGSLVITGPNAAWLLGSFSRYSDITHQQSFTEFSLTQLLEMAEFSRIELLKPEIFSLSTWRRVRSWRRPWAGLGLRILLNDLLHRLVYKISGLHPQPQVYSHEFTVKAIK